MFGANKALLAIVTGLVAAALAAPAPAQAQQEKTVTGCLSKGPSEGTYSLKATDGKTYTLSSTSVSLAEHVGHRVRVTGKAAGVETGAVSETGMKRDTSRAAMAPETGGRARAAPDTGRQRAGAAAGGTLEVTSMKHLSAQCK